jgi:hypothetical protein
MMEIKQEKKKKRKEKKKHVMSVVKMTSSYVHTRLSIAADLS